MIRIKPDEQTEKTIHRIEERVSKLESLLMPGIGITQDLLRGEAARKESGLAILWVTIDPGTGVLAHKFVGYDEIFRFFGTRHQEASVGLEKAELGEPVYIDGAFFMKVQTAHKQPANIKRYKLGGTE